MSLSMLRKQCGIEEPEMSSEAKEATQPAAARGRAQTAGRGGSRGGSRGGGGGGYYASGGVAASRSSGNSSQTGNSSGYGPEKEGGFSIAYPKPSGTFRGSSAQAAHIEAVRKAAAEASKETAAETDTSVAVKSGLGLDALKERKRQEAMDREAKRDAARAKRHNETTKKEADDEAALAECERQAQIDSEDNEDVKYEAALVVRIACYFGANSAWMKISEARARGAEIPSDPRRVYLLVHPDKCHLPEASDATAILNAQRPPEMAEVRVSKPASSKAPAAATEVPADPEAEAKHKEYLARQQQRAERLGKTEASAPPATAPAARGPATATPAASAGTADEERRIDPEDSKLCTLQELQEKYRSVYTPTEIEAYFKDECKPQRRVKRF